METSIDPIGELSNLLDTNQASQISLQSGEVLD
jgi:hypothetical protein